MTLMQSEDALAAVLGHEVEHVDLRHCAERVQTEQRLRNLGPLGDLLGLPVEIFIAGYSKDQEIEADRNGTALAVEAGYSPLGILQLFKEFARLEKKLAATPALPPLPSTKRPNSLWAPFRVTSPPTRHPPSELNRLKR